MLVTRSSQFLTLGWYYICGGYKGPPPKIQRPLVAQKVLNISKIGRTTSLALITKSKPADFCDNWICSQGARAAFVLSTQSCFTPFEK